MDVGIVHFMAYPDATRDDSRSVETLEALCRDDYFRVVEVTHIGDETVRRRAIELVRKFGKRTVFGAQPVLLGSQADLNSCDPPVRQKALDVARAALAEAKEWQPDWFVVLSGPDTAPPERPLARAMLIASLKELCEFSRRQANAPVVLEVFDRLPQGRHRLIGPTEEAADVADQVYPYFLSFGLMIDLSHIPLLGESPEQAVRAASPYLRSVHIGNCVVKDPQHPAYGDNHPVLGTPGGENGVDEVAAFLRALLEVGYIGPEKHNIVSFEVKPFGNQTSEEVISRSKEVLDAAWAAL